MPASMATAEQARKLGDDYGISPPVPGGRLQGEECVRGAGRSADRSWLQLGTGPRPAWVGRQCFIGCYAEPLSPDVGVFRDGRDFLGPVHAWRKVSEDRLWEGLYRSYLLIVPLTPRSGRRRRANTRNLRWILRSMHFSGPRL